MNNQKSCQTCVFWDRVKQEYASRHPIGYCRRSAPMPGVKHPEPAAIFWPVTADKDWCGEHKPRVGNE